MDGNEFAALFAVDPPVCCCSGFKVPKTALSLPKPPPSWSLQLYSKSFNFYFSNRSYFVTQRREKTSCIEFIEPSFNLFPPLFFVFIFYPKVLVSEI